MKLRAQNYVLGFAALLCLIDGFLAPKGSDPGPALTAVTGILLVRRFQGIVAVGVSDPASIILYRT
jgi:hypothetical protein